MDHLAEGRRVLLRVDDREEVVVLGVGIDAVDVEVLLCAVESLGEGRQASFRFDVRQSHGKSDDESCDQSDSAHALLHDEMATFLQGQTSAHWRVFYASGGSGVAPGGGVPLPARM